MPLDRLTQKSKALVIELSDSERVTAGAVFRKISDSSGFGSYIVKKFPDIKVNKRTRMDVEDLVKQSYYQSARLEHPYVGTEHILLALLNITRSKDYKNTYDYISNTSMFPKALKISASGPENIILDTFGTNLNHEFATAYHEPLVFREELNAIVSVLLKRSRKNPLIVGDSGVGKGSLINLLVRSISSLDVPPVLAGYQVIEFDLMGYVSSVANKGGLDASLLGLQEELRGLKRTILSIKNFQSLFVSTSAGVGVPLLYTMFKDTLESSGVGFIATMNSSVFDKINLDNSYLFDNFTVVEVSEPSEEETLKILKLKAKVLGEFHNISISDPMVKFIYGTAKDEITGTSFPQKGVDLLDVACANLLVSKSKIPSEYKKLVDKTVDMLSDLDKKLEFGEYEEAAKLQAKMKTIDTSLTSYEDEMIYSKPLRLRKSDVKRALKDMDYVKEADEIIDSNALRGLSKKLKKRVIGQEEAIDTVVKALIRAKMGLRARKRPVGSFLFLGPTGVGKTELARVLGEQTNLIRLDMSDFSEKHTVARLVGAPPGYVGYGEGGELTQKIESHPESVVLFDEIEKAHPDVLNILLQIMEEGELSDAKGVTYDFSKSVVILTSNIGTEILHGSEIGFVEGLKFADDSKVSANLKLNLKKILKPELLNRFDEIVVFNRLDKSDQVEVLELMLDEVQDGLSAQEVYLKISISAKRFLLKVGYSDEYGARALRRVVEKELLDEVAQVLLDVKKRPLVLAAKAGKKGIKVTTG